MKGAVLLDALGTLLELEPPAPALRESLRERCGLEVDEDTAGQAIAAEISFYRQHVLEGGDGEGLSRLRRRCAEVLRSALGEPAAGLPLEDVEAALLGGLRFRAFPEVPPALERMREAGLRLVVVSNWDVSLHQRLREAGIAERVDGAVASAEVGVAKPDPAPFVRGLALAGVAAGQALHAGDSLEEDVAGARAAGIEPVLVARDGAPGGAGVRTVSSLAEVADLAT